MKKAMGWCLVGVLALAAGCARKGEVILLKKLPEIEISGLDELMEFEQAEISKDRMWVMIPGRAKQDLGRGYRIEVTRFQDGERLDTITAYVTRAEPMPGTEAWDGEGPAPLGKGPSLNDGPPTIPPVAAGEKIKVSVDATTNTGRITKIALGPE